MDLKSPKLASFLMKLVTNLCTNKLEIKCSLILNFELYFIPKCVRLEMQSLLNQSIAKIKFDPYNWI